MAEDLEYGHVVDLTLGELDGTALTADAAISATSLSVEYGGDFEPDGGMLLLNDVTLAYTEVAEGVAEGDPDVITLADPLTVAATADDRVGLVAGGQPVLLWQLHVDLGDGHPVDIDIPFEQRALWSTVDVSTPVPVVLSADLERLVEVPGRTPVLDGSLIDPATLPDSGSGQTFSPDPPPGTTDGYAEDHAWWQVVDGEVVGFWRVTGAAWVEAAIVRGDAAYFQNALIEALQVTGLTAVEIQTASSGQRIMLTSFDGGGGPSGEIRFYTGNALEDAYGYLSTYSATLGSDTLLWTALASPEVAGSPGDSAALVLTSFRNSGGVTESYARFDADRVESPNLFLTDPPTGSFANNVNISASGQIREITSSLRFKQDVEDAQVDPALVLNLRPRTWRDRAEVEADPTVETRHVGFIAEEVHAAGFPELVIYDDDGPRGLQYDRFVVPLLELARSQQEQIVDLSERLARVEAALGIV